MRIVDMTGQRFGRLVVVERGPNARDGQARWRTRCDCGNMTLVTGGSLRRGVIVSCGCYNHEKFTARQTKHGQCRRPGSSAEYALWKYAKRRARALGLLFNLDVSDIVIPDRCPALGIPLKTHKLASALDSPTLDRIHPEMGYVKGNVWVISLRANRVKGNCTLSELEALVSALRDKISKGIAA